MKTGFGLGPRAEKYRIGYAAGCLSPAHLANRAWLATDTHSFGNLQK
jgi:hypothetical protein